MFMGTAWIVSWYSINDIMVVLLDCVKEKVGCSQESHALFLK
jgi:hypothetical protein